MWTQKRIVTSYWNYFPAPSTAYQEVSLDNFSTHPILNALGDVLLAKNQQMGICFFSSLFSEAVLDNPVAKAALDQIMTDTVSAGNVRGYFIIDEPGADKFPEAARLCRYIEQAAPNALPYINVWPIYASENQLGVDYAAIDQSMLDYPGDLNQIQGKARKIFTYLQYLHDYISVVQPQALSYDHYHFFEIGNGDEFFLNLAIIAREAKKANVPFFNTIQSGKDAPLWTLPSEAQMRFQIFVSLAYGCRGIIHYTYWGTASTGSLYQSGTRTPLADSVRLLNKEIASLSSYLICCNCVGTYQIGVIPVGGKRMPELDLPIKINSSSDLTIGLFGHGEAVQAIMVANNSYLRPAVFRFTSSLLVWRINKLTGEWIKPENASLKKHETQVALAPGDGELLIFSFWAG